MLIQHIAQCVPECHSVDLENPDIVILVEIFKVRLSSLDVVWHVQFIHLIAERLWCFDCSGLLSVAEIQCYGDYQRKERSGPHRWGFCT